MLCSHSFSQRSIQDEINRESRSDVRTIIISYTVMFVYVAVMLGRYRSCARFFVSINHPFIAHVILLSLTREHSPPDSTCATPHCDVFLFCRWRVRSCWVCPEF